MDAVEVGRALRQIGQLLEIEGANPFRARAYKQAGDALATSGLPLETALAQPGTVAGLGKDTAGAARLIVEQGLPKTLLGLGIVTPLSVIELTRVPGIGPKTAGSLYRNHDIRSLESLQTALATGNLRYVQGFGPNRLQRLARDVNVLLSHEHLLPISMAWPLAMEIQSALKSLPGVTDVAVSGAFRRLVVEYHRIDLVVALDDDTAFLSWCEQWPRLTRVAESVEVTLPTYQKPVTVRLETTNASGFAARLMRTTGDETHQAVMEGLLNQAGCHWSGDTITDANGDVVTIDEEADIYQLVGMSTLPPECREAASLLCKPEQLVQLEQIRGDLHVHSDWSDGWLTLDHLVDAAERIGYEYLAITDHSQSLTIAHGLTPERLAEQRQEILRLREQTKVHLLQGIEVDILGDGTLDLPDDILWDLDIVVASVHSAMHQPAVQMTDRILRAIQHPAVDIIGHPTGRVIGRRSGYELDFPRLTAAAAEHGVILELNANPNRLDLGDDLLRQAKAAGVMTAIDTDTHHPDEFAHVSYGIRMAQRACLGAADVMNTLPYTDLVKRLHRERNHAL